VVAPNLLPTHILLLDFPGTTHHAGSPGHITRTESYDPAQFVSTRLEVVTRVVILTGRSGGIGRSSVMNLAARRVNVVFTYGSK
jgi:hypothetical protein